MSGIGNSTSVDPAPAAPFLIAHRAGNDLSRLRQAQALGLPLIEADLHLYAGRLEIRHLKTLGPLPILWDRWTLAPPWTPRLLLDRLLAAVAPGTHLMLDLKGRDARLPALVVAALSEHAPGRSVSVCARHWPLLESLAACEVVRPVHSVGSARQLAVLRQRLGGRSIAGISIHRRLLNAAVVSDLRDRAELVMSWPVETPDEARTLADWGVQGLITSRYAELAAVLPAAAPMVAA